MIQVLHRAFGILESAAADPGRPRALGEIARAAGLNKATCAHILKTLVATGYMEQIAPRKGYRLGPRAYALGGGRAYRPDLVAAAEPALADLAAETRETALLAVLRGDTRYTLCQVDGQRDVRVRAEPMAARNVYETATGRLLLAFSPVGDVDAFVAGRGLPGEAWPEVKSADDLGKALAAIRRRRRVVNVTPTHVAGIAAAVVAGGEVVAAVGLFLPDFRFKGPHRKAVIDGVERTAARISQLLGDRDVANF